MRITVTSGDIAEGERGSACSCPVALALRRKLPGWHHIAVCSTRIEFKEGEDGVPAPEEVAAFVSLFDQGGRVAPFSFEIEVP